MQTRTGKKIKTRADIAETLLYDIPTTELIDKLRKAKAMYELLSPEQIRALIATELLEHGLNAEKTADKLNALKLLGTVSEISAYTHRSESVQIKASVDIKQQLAERLKLIANSNRQNELVQPTISADAQSLLDELRNAPQVIEGELIEQGEEFPELSAISGEHDADSDNSAANS